MAHYVSHRLIQQYIPPGNWQKDNTAIRFPSGGHNYRIYVPQRPDIAPLNHGGLQIIYNMDYDKGKWTDPHASVMLQFNRSGRIIGVDIDRSSARRIKIPLTIEKGKGGGGESVIPISDIIDNINQSGGTLHFAHVVAISIAKVDFAVVGGRKRHHHLSFYRG